MIAQYLGQPIRRTEDYRFLRGQGCYVGDISVPDLLEVAFLRSSHAHARVVNLRTERAKSVSGVVAVLSGKDISADDLDQKAIKAGAFFPLLVCNMAHYVGEPIALVAALSRHVAEDGCDEVEVDYEPLPVVANIEAALAAGAPFVREDVENNVAVRKEIGYGNVEAGFREAEVVIEEEFRIARAAAHALEPRGILASPDTTTGGLTIWAGTQMPHLLRRAIAQFLGLPERLIRLIAPDVGGGFGSKAGIYSEDFLIPYVAWKLKRPVRWLEDRKEHFVATLQGREQIHKIRLGAKRDGKLVAVEDTLWMDMGAYPAWPHLMENSARTLPGPYNLPHYRCIINGVVTHKTPAGPYRGAGRPQGNFVMERMMDRLAEATDLDPAEVRRRNLIRSEEMPYEHPIGRTYDSGDYRKLLDETLKLIDYSDFRKKQKQTRKEGKFVGIGLSTYIEDTGGAGAYEGALVRLEVDGSFTVYSGAPASGQGHETIFAQAVAEYFGVPMERVHVNTTDTSAPLHLGLGTFGSRSAGIAVGAIWEACKKLELRLKQLAESLLEASAEDLEIRAGGVEVKGTPSRRVTFQQIGELGNSISFAPLPPGVLPGAEATGYMRGRPQYGCGTHACVVEVQQQTGEVKLLSYAVVHDCGTLLNPMIVTGQVHGGVAHGVGTALLEELRYDENGQLQNGTYMDYLLPTAGDLPMIRVEHLEFPSPFTPTGAKGAGEGGTIPALACVANAVEDALKPLGIRIRQLPITPNRLFELMIARREK